MSDFFSNLAGRLEGTVPVLRPRLPSLFENAPGAPMTARDAEPALVVEDMERDAGPAPPRRLEVRTASVEATPPEESEERLVEPSRRKQAKHGEVREERAETAERQVPAPSRRPARRRDEPSAPMAETLRDVPRPPAIEPARAPSLATEPPHPPQTIVRRSIVERHEEVHRFAPAAASAPQPAAARAAPLQNVTPAPPPFAPPRSALPQGMRHELREQAKPAARQEAGESTIHVSIGRAEAEASPRRKTAETSPVMSLDEYLRSRVR
jgi:hypothetical protein